MFSKLNYITFFIIILFFLFPIFCFANEVDEELDINNILQEITEASANVSTEPITNSRANIIFDRNSKTVVFGNNIDEKKPMASTTKIMTAILVIEQANLTDIVEVSKKSANTGGSRLGLHTGDKITLENLLYGLMLKSGNDAAIAIAEHISGTVEEFIELMNIKAKELGLINTNFVTPHGLDSDEHYTTVKELAILTDYALNNNIFSKIVKTSSYNITINNSSHNINNTNELLGNLNGVYGVKTGFTNKAGRCLVTSIKRDDTDIICIVLGADTKKQRTSDSIKLIEYTFKNYTTVNLKELIYNDFEKWYNINNSLIYIEKGKKQNTNFILEDLDFNKMLIKNDSIKNIKINIDSASYLKAPVFKNTPIGNLIVLIDNTEIINKKILTNEYIDKKHVFDYFLECLNIPKTINLP